MPEYKFGEHQGDEQKTPKPSRAPLNIPVQDGNISFDLGGQKASHFAGTVPSPMLENQTTIPGLPAKPAVTKSAQSSAKPPVKKASETPQHFGLRIWHALEFIAVSAAIFAVLFFFLNYGSYSQLFLTKLDLLRGQMNQNPYSEQQNIALKNASVEGQKPLPIVNTSQAAKKQVPDLTLEIAPPDKRIIIPRIGQNVPIVQVPTDTLLRKDWKALESQIQDALRHGVVHFPGTAYPGSPGNVVITGHSSYFPWDPGRFKDVFALLHQVDLGDQIVVYNDQKKYTYQVYDKKVVKPSEVEVLTQAGESRLTLITCTPVGTDLNRLIILARPISVS